VSNVHYLSVDNVLRLHRLAIDQFGGAQGIRDAALLESAVMTPQAAFGGHELHPDMPSKCAAYLYHISQAHAFVDGNKRAAMAAALTFARLNDHEINADDDELIEIGLGVAAGTMGKDELTERFRRIITPT
jgi:death on curing protein